VRGVASLGNFPYYLVSNNPKVKTIADFSDKDRIALPAVGVSVQSRVLQLASARLWGDAQYNKLDKISIAVPHPDATAAIISGGTEITGHFGNPPFQEQELAGKPHIVLKSYDVLGGPSSATVLYATEKFRKDNPKTYGAFLGALDEAAKFISANPEKAADIYLKVNKGNTDRKLLLQIIKNPEVQFKIAAEYLRPGRVHASRGRHQEQTRLGEDYFFDDAHIQEVAEMAFR
jgi:NitT/TauT family transport system substrate-binding protein